MTTRRPFGPTMSQAFTWVAAALEHEAEASADVAPGNRTVCRRAAAIVRQLRDLGALDEPPSTTSIQSPTPDATAIAAGASSNA